MKKYVFTVKDDVCASNGKDVNATELIEKMKLYGSVEDYERVLAIVRAEYQATVDGLTQQINAIRAYDLSNDEFELVKAYRECKDNISAMYMSRIDALENQLHDIRAEEQMRLEKIMSILGA